MFSQDHTQLISKCSQGYVGVGVWWEINELMGEFAGDYVYLPPLKGPNGDCAVIEFDKEDGWKTMVVRKGEGENSMLVTNHLLSPKYYTEIPDQSVGNTHSRSWWRYETVNEYMVENGGILTLEGMQKGLEMVRWVDLPQPDGEVEDTQWSNVYDQTDIVLYLRNWNSYDRTCKFTL